MAGRHESGYLVLFLIAACFPIVSGCSEDDGIGERYAVRGTVTYKGEPLKHGTVNFSPEGTAGRPASGAIEDGGYEVTTLTPGDGMLPAKYKVAIQANYTDMSKVVGNPGGLYRTDLIPKAPKVKLIPRKYESPATSGLSAEVKPERNTINFDLRDEELDAKNDPLYKTKGRSSRKKG